MQLLLAEHALHRSSHRTARSRLRGDRRWRIAGKAGADTTQVLMEDLRVTQAAVLRQLERVRERFGALDPPAGEDRPTGA